MTINNKNNHGVTVWFTGLSGTGKTTICLEVAKKLRIMGYKVFVLDGDNIRQNISTDLGFSRADRKKNMHLAGFLAFLLTQSKFIVLASLISPFREVRDEIRQQIKNFIEVYVNTPLAICEKRDVKRDYTRWRGKVI